MGIFGWSYPPGCSGPPDEYEGPCEVCGNSVDDCICPECPVCHVQGDPRCYERVAPSRFVRDHGLVRSVEQDWGAALLEESYRQQAAADRAEAEYWTDPQRKVEEAAFNELMRQEGNV